MAEVLLYLLFPFLTLLLLQRVGARRNNGHNPDHRRLPPSPPALPIVGHLHLVGARPHVSLRDVAGRHGADGLVLLRLGQVPTLVVSSPRAAEAVLGARDAAFASRQRSAVADVLLSGAADVAMVPYGEYWRQARRLVTTHLLGGRKVRVLRRAREEEALLVLAGIREVAAAAHDAVVDVTDVLGAFANDVVCRAVSGRFFRAEGRNRVFRELIAGNVALLGGFNLGDYFPSLAKVGVLTRILCARARRLKKRWNELLDEIIDEHAARSPSVHEDRDGKNDVGQSQEEEDRDLVDVLLSLQQEYSLTREQIKAILMDMFAAGTDTSSMVLEYATIGLIKNPHLMTKLQAEVTKNTPKDQEMVKEENLNNMTYLRAVVKETLRLYPPTPLLLPHLCMENCDVNRYKVTAGTRVIVNAWALGRDTMSWEKTHEFMPERFVDSGNNIAVDFKGRDFMFLPFGAGRRMCPGMNFGMASIEIMLANLMYCFHWELPAGMTKEDVDMTDVHGLTMRRKEKLLLVSKLSM